VRKDKRFIPESALSTPTTWQFAPMTDSGRSPSTKNKARRSPGFALHFQPICYLPYVAVKLVLANKALPIPLFRTKPYNPAVPVLGTPPATSNLSTDSANNVKM
jgi:hypothetical protein